jgi:hypothetical protein
VGGTGAEHTNARHTPPQPIGVQDPPGQLVRVHVRGPALLRRLLEEPCRAPLVLGQRVAQALQRVGRAGVAAVDRRAARGMARGARLAAAGRGAPLTHLRMCAGVPWLKRGGEGG